MRYAEAGLSAEGSSAPREPILSNSVLGVTVFILTEVMFFVALISAYMISKANAVEWPPAGQARLPIEATAFNTAVLILSAVMMFLAGRAFDREGFNRRSEQFFLLAVGLGTFFVIFQGTEWVRLLGEGLTVTSGSYAAFFYLIIGTHAIHAIGALIALARLYWKFKTRTLRVQSFRAGQVFWYFVVGVWPVLYYLVYLS